jgi:hypothetical protein
MALTAWGTGGGVINYVVAFSANTTENATRRWIIRTGGNTEPGVTSEARVR